MDYVDYEPQVLQFQASSTSALESGLMHGFHQGYISGLLYNH
jgi:hypothetical protein